MKGERYMKKRVYRRALRIAAQCFARAGFFVSAIGPVCKAPTERKCARCIRAYFLQKAKEELALEGKE